eukprot:TRINITY_DN5926_c0_g1_i1.p1 TRINITY_DN5926_c0_g1~~TRINITY_DN5926_c0_g1_i1.p1  ORF type:complete len:4064 (-),score=1384.08 TRINITY_DN5926_c0_g1_i1:18-10829(-)
MATGELQTQIIRLQADLATQQAVHAQELRQAKRDASAAQQRSADLLAQLQSQLQAHQMLVGERTTDSDQQVLEARSRMNIAEDKYAQLQRQMSERQRQMETQKDAIDTQLQLARDELSDVTAQLTQSEVTRLALKDQLSIFETQARARDVQMVSLQQREADARESVRQLQIQLEEARDAALNLTVSSPQAVSSPLVGASPAAVQRSLQRKEQQLAEAQAAVAAATTSAAQDKATIAELQSQLQKLQSDNSMQQAEHDSQVRQLKRAAKQIESAHADLSLQLQTQQRTMAEQLVEAERQLEDARAHVSTADAKSQQSQRDQSERVRQLQLLVEQLQSADSARGNMIRQLEADMAELQQELTSLQETNRTKTDQLAMSTDEISSLKSRLQSLTTQLAQAIAELRQLRDDSSGLITEKEQLRGQLDAANQKIVELAAQPQQTAQSKQRLERQKQEIDQLTLRVEELQKQKAEADAALLTRADEVTRLQARLSELSVHMQQAQKTAREKTAASASSVQQLEGQLRSTEAKLKLATDELAELQSQLLECESKLRKSLDSERQLDAALKLRDNQVISLQTMESEQRELAQELQAQLEQLQEELQQNELMASVTTREAEPALAASAIAADSAARALTRKEHELADVTRQLETAISSLAAEQAQVAELQSQLQRAQADSASQVAQRDGQLRQLKRDAKQTSTRAEEAEQQLASQQRLWKQTVDDLEAQLSAAHAKVSTTETRLHQASLENTERVAQLQRRIDELSSGHTSTHEEMERLQSELSDTQLQLEQSLVQVRSRQEQLGKLQEETAALRSRNQVQQAHALQVESDRNARISQLEEEITDANLKLAAAIARAADLEQRALQPSTQSQSRAERHRLELEALNQRIDELMKQKSDVDAVVATRDEQLLQLSAKQADAAASIQQLQQAAREAKIAQVNAVQVAEQQLRSVESKCKNLEDELADLNAQFSECDARARKALERQQQAESALQTRNVQIGILQQREADAADKLRQANSELEELRDAHLTSVSTSDSSALAAALTTQLEDVQRQLRQAQNVSTRKDSEVLDLQSRLTAATAANESALTMLRAQYDAALATATEELNEHRAKLRETKRALKQSRSEGTDAQQQAAAQQRQFAQQVRDAEDRATEAGTRVAAMQEQVTRLQSELAEQTQKLQTTAQSQAASTNTNSALVRELKEQLAEAEAEVENLQRQQAQMAGEAQAARDELSSIQSKLTQQVAKLAAADETSQALARQLQQKTDENAALAQHLQESQAIVEQVQQMVAESRSTSKQQQDKQRSSLIQLAEQLEVLRSDKLVADATVASLSEQVATLQSRSQASESNSQSNLQQAREKLAAALTAQQKAEMQLQQSEANSADLAADVVRLSDALKVSETQLQEISTQFSQLESASRARDAQLRITEQREKDTFAQLQRTQADLEAMRDESLRAPTAEAVPAELVAKLDETTRALRQAQNALTRKDEETAALNARLATLAEQRQIESAELNAQLQKLLDDSSARSSEQDAQLRQGRREISQLRAQVAELTAKCEAASRQTSSISEQTQQQLDSLQNRLAAAEAKLVSAQADAADAVRQVQSKLDFANKTSAVSRNQVVQLESTLEEVQHKLDAMSVAEMKARRDVDISRSQIDELQQQLLAVTSSSETNLAQMSHAVEAAKAQVAKLTADLAQESETAKETCARLQDELQTSKTRCEHLSDELAATSDACDEAKRENSLMKYELDRMNSELDRARMSNAAAKHQLQEAERRVTEQHASSMTASQQLESQLRVSDEKLKQLQLEYSNVMEDHSATETKLRKAQDLLQQAESTVATRSSQLQASQAELMQSQEELNALQAQLPPLREAAALVPVLEQRLIDTKQALTDAEQRSQQALQAARDRQAVTVSSNELLETELRAARANVQQLEADTATLRAQQTVMEGKLRAATEAQQLMDTTLATRSAELRAAQEASATTGSKLNDVSQQLQEANETAVAAAAKAAQELSAVKQALAANEQLLAEKQSELQASQSAIIEKDSALQHSQHTLSVREAAATSSNEQLQAELVAALSRVSDLEAERERLREALASEQTARHSAEQSATAAQAQVGTRGDEISTLEERIKDLKQQLKSNLLLLDEKHEQMVEKESARAALAVQMEQQAAALQKQQREHEALSNSSAERVKTLENELVESRNARDELEQRTQQTLVSLKEARDEERSLLNAEIAELQATLSKVQGELTELMAARDAVQKRLDEEIAGRAADKAARAERDEEVMRMIQANLKHLGEDHEAALAAKNSAIAQLQQQIKEAEGNLHASDRDADVREQLIEHLEREVEEYRERSGGYEENLALRKNVEELENTIAEMTTAAEARDATIGKMNERAELLAAQIQQLTSAGDEGLANKVLVLTAELKIAHEKAATHQHDYNTVQQQLQSMKSQHQKVIDSMDKRIGMLSTQVTNAELATEAANDKVTERDATIKTLEEQLNDVQKQYDSILAVVEDEDARSRLQEMAFTLQTQAKTAQTLEAENEELVRQIAVERDEHANTREALHEQERTSTELRSELVDLRSQVQHLRTNVLPGLESDLVNEQRKFHELSSKLAQTEEQLTEKESEILGLQAEIADLQLERRARSASQLQSAAAEDTAQKVSVRLQRLTQQLAEAQAESSKQQCELESLQQRAESAEKEAEEAKMRLHRNRRMSHVADRYSKKHVDRVAELESELKRRDSEYSALMRSPMSMQSVSSAPVPTVERASSPVESSVLSNLQREGTSERVDAMLEQISSDEDRWLFKSLIAGYYSQAEDSDSNVRDYIQKLELKDAEIERLNEELAMTQLQIHDVATEKDEEIADIRAELEVAIAASGAPVTISPPRAELKQRAEAAELEANTALQQRAQMEAIAAQAVANADKFAEQVRMLTGRWEEIRDVIRRTQPEEDDVSEDESTPVKPPAPVQLVLGTNDPAALDEIASIVSLAVAEARGYQAANSEIQRAARAGPQGQLFGRRPSNVVVAAVMRDDSAGLGARLAPTALVRDLAAAHRELQTGALRVAQLTTELDDARTTIKRLQREILLLSQPSGQQHVEDITPRSDTGSLFTPVATKTIVPLLSLPVVASVLSSTAVLTPSVHSQSPLSSPLTSPHSREVVPASADRPNSALPVAVDQKAVTLQTALTKQQVRVFIMEDKARKSQEDATGAVGAATDASDRIEALQEQVEELTAALEEARNELERSREANPYVAANEALQEELQRMKTQVALARNELVLQARESIETRRKYEQTMHQLQADAADSQATAVRAAQGRGENTQSLRTQLETARQALATKQRRWSVREEELSAEIQRLSGAAPRTATTVANPPPLPPRSPARHRSPMASPRQMSAPQIHLQQPSPVHMSPRRQSRNDSFAASVQTFNVHMAQQAEMLTLVEGPAEYREHELRATMSLLKGQVLTLDRHGLTILHRQLKELEGWQDKSRLLKRAHQAIKHVVMLIAGEQGVGEQWNITFDQMCSIPPHLVRQLLHSLQQLVIAFDNVHASEHELRTVAEVVANAGNLVQLAAIATRILTEANAADRMSPAVSYEQLLPPPRLPLSAYNSHLSPPPPNPLGDALREQKELSPRSRSESQ